MATTLDQHTVTDLTHDELAGRLSEHRLAGALVRKSSADPVPFPVWWRVADALRDSVLDPGRDAVATIDDALAALIETTGDRTALSGVPRWSSDDPARALHRAQLLVARLVFSTAPTSPTLLQVRLARLRRSLVATL